jgi:hypothetical protein
MNRLKTFNEHVSKLDDLKWSYFTEITFDDYRSIKETEVNISKDLNDIKGFVDKLKVLCYQQTSDGCITVSKNPHSYFINKCENDYYLIIDHYIITSSHPRYSRKNSIYTQATSDYYLCDHLDGVFRFLSSKLK